MCVGGGGQQTLYIIYNIWSLVDVLKCSTDFWHGYDWAVIYIELGFLSVLY